MPQENSHRINYLQLDREAVGRAGGAGQGVTPALILNPVRRGRARSDAVTPSARAAGIAQGSANAMTESPSVVPSLP